VTKLAVPRKVKLTAKKPVQIKPITAKIQNRSAHAETIPDLAALDGLVHVTVESLGACPAPVPILRAAAVQKKLPIVLKSKKALSVVFDVTFTCANNPAKTTKDTPDQDDYRFSARVDHRAIGDGDAHPEDDVCPRTVTPPAVLDPYPDGKIRDRGCGARKADKTFGNPVVVDVVGQ